MAFATSTQWAEIFRQTVPGFAASDIVAKTLVQVASASDFLFVPVATTNQEPLGFSADDYQQGNAAVVHDGYGAIIQVLAGATTLQRQDVGINGTATEIHPISGNVVTYPEVGPVSGASGSVVFRVGVAVTSGIPGEQILVRIAPKQLSGLV